MCSGIKLDEFNHYIRKGFAYRKLFPGATVKDLDHHCELTLSDDKPDACVINIGSNNLGKDQPHEIANQIIRIVNKCHEHGVNKVYVSSIPLRIGKDREMRGVYNILRAKTFLHDFILIDNSNIKHHHLGKDNIHLNYNGTIVLANNFIRAINGTRADWHALGTLQSSQTKIDPPPPPPHSTDCNISQEKTVDYPANLKTLKLNNINRLLIGCININSIKGKFDSFKKIVMANLDIIVVNESKIDASFTQQQFAIEGYHLPYRRDRNAFGGGVMTFVREDIPCREIVLNKDEEKIEGIFIEISTRKQKWLFFGGYCNKKANISDFLSKLGSIIGRNIFSFLATLTQKLQNQAWLNFVKHII